MRNAGCRPGAFWRSRAGLECGGAGELRIDGTCGGTCRRNVPQERAAGTCRRNVHRNVPQGSAALRYNGEKRWRGSACLALCGAL